MAPRTALGLTIAAMAVTAAGCASSPSFDAPPRALRPDELVFLTREGCVNTAVMRDRLDRALTMLGLPTTYVVIDVDTLDASDARRGYGTPTILYRNRDLFGMPSPAAGVPDPT
jgi:hypothetical protein